MNTQEATQTWNKRNFVVYKTNTIVVLIKYI